MPSKPAPIKKPAKKEAAKKDKAPEPAPAPVLAPEPVPVAAPEPAPEAAPSEAVPAPAEGEAEPVEGEAPAVSAEEAKRPADGNVPNMLVSQHQQTAIFALRIGLTLNPLNLRQTGLCHGKHLFIFTHGCLCMLGGKRGNIDSGGRISS